MDADAHNQCVTEARSMITDFLHSRLQDSEYSQAESLVNGLVDALAPDEEDAAADEDDDESPDEKRRKMTGDSRLRSRSSETDFNKRFPGAALIGKV